MDFVPRLNFSTSVLIINIQRFHRLVPSVTRYFHWISRKKSDRFNGNRSIDCSIIILLFGSEFTLILFNCNNNNAAIIMKLVSAYRQSLLFIVHRARMLIDVDFIPCVSYLSQACSLHCFGPLQPPSGNVRTVPGCSVQCNPKVITGGKELHTLNEVSVEKVTWSV